MDDSEFDKNDTPPEIGSLRKWQNVGRKWYCPKHAPRYYCENCLFYEGGQCESTDPKGTCDTWHKKIPRFD